MLLEDLIRPFFKELHWLAPTEASALNWRNFIANKYKRNLYAGLYVLLYIWCDDLDPAANDIYIWITRLENPHIPKKNFRRLIERCIYELFGTPNLS